MTVCTKAYPSLGLRHLLWGLSALGAAAVSHISDPTSHGGVTPDLSLVCVSRRIRINNCVE